MTPPSPFSSGSDGPSTSYRDPLLERPVRFDDLDCSLAAPIDIAAMKHGVDDVVPVLTAST